MAINFAQKRRKKLEKIEKHLFYDSIIRKGNLKPLLDHRKVQLLVPNFKHPECKSGYVFIGNFRNKNKIEKDLSQYAYYIGTKVYISDMEKSDIYTLYPDELNIGFDKLYPVFILSLSLIKKNYVVKK